MEHTMDGVTYVEPSYSPIIHEGMEPATVVITNAGPAGVEVRVWIELQPPGTQQDPFARLELRPGNTRSVSGCLIRAAIHTPHPPAMPQGRPLPSPAAPFAALGWKVVR
jgi:hypothetical protein